MEICDKCNISVIRSYQAEWLCSDGHWNALPKHLNQYNALHALEVERGTFNIHEWRLVEVIEIVTKVDSGNNKGQRNEGYKLGA